MENELKTRKEILDDLFNENRKEIDKCDECKKHKRVCCKKHSIIDNYLRIKLYEKADLQETGKGVN